MNPPSFRIVARPKLSGIGAHMGVALPTGQVMHHGPGGVQLDSLARFAQGRAVREVERAAPTDYASVMQRAASIARQPLPYRLFDSNCEHFAHWLVSGKAKSPQIAGVVVLAIVVAIVLNS